MQKVLVTGANGQLGRELAEHAPEVELLALGRDALDIADPNATLERIAALAPDVVINAAAYTAVDRAESEPERARQVNAAGAGHLARACASLGVRMLHVSTDFVFDGQAGTPYDPSAATNPLGVYGASKLDGEKAVRECLPRALIVRTGWVYSRFGGNFVKTMLRLMGERDTLRVVGDQVGTPTWAAGLARALWDFAARPELHGTYHWSDAGVCSWYDFAVAIAEEGLARGLLTRPVTVAPIPASDYPTPARRPAYSVLDKGATWADLGRPGVHWREQLRRMLDEYKEHHIE
ncbi:dTDP-4-dehydrorhamnose reductase [Parahaliea mediterranea]|uniref:dTDP-4-dehydrorhamnose reductase n=1 Tax=Parahaliea mediterranea TaxID=651086 RepID=A0A939IM44_9GAMM|nr:dTDP-4-dehydrorhamnose reductase [Parahaliea mediterranea]MBN7799036.1 dTDP-4-dehydrorhamnose reductase [Parahaliea mediterranea]